MIVGGAVLELADGVLKDASGRVIALRPQSMKVLMYLAERPEKVVHRDELIEAVWGEVHVTDDSLAQCIGDIRKAVGDETRQTLQTVPKIGYRLAPGIPGPVVKSAFRRLEPRILGTMAVSLVVLLLVSIGLWTNFAPENQPLADERPSIAVLPYDDVGNDPRWQRLGRGFAAEVGGALARNDWLTASFPDTASGGTAGARLAGQVPRFQLSGSLQHSGGVVRVVSLLTETATGRIAWSDSWSGPEDQLLSATDQILARLDASLAASFNGAVARSVRSEAHRLPTEKLGAFELYLLAAEAKHKFSHEGYREALAYLDRAVTIDPEFGRAWATINLVHVMITDFENDPAAVAAHVAASNEAGRRAYNAAPGDPMVMNRYGIVLSNEGDFVGALRIEREAYNRSVGDPDLIMFAVFAGLAAGIPGKEALVWAERAMALNSKPPDWYFSALGVAEFFAGNYPAARHAASLGPNLSDTHIVAVAAAAMMGDTVAAKAAYDKMLQGLGPQFTLEESYLYNVAPEPAEALRQAFRRAGLPVSGVDVANVVKDGG